MNRPNPESARDPALRRVFFWLLLLAAGLPMGAGASGPERPSSRDVGATRANQAEGAAVLRDFRAQGIRGVYWLQFELRVLPRQGAERVVAGELFGRQGATGPLTRLSARDVTPDGRAREERYLLQAGPSPEAWRWSAADPAAGVRPVAPGEMLARVQGTDFTVFDLQMPFLYWPDFVYEGLAKVRARPAHSFLLYPPAELAATLPSGVVAPAAVRVWLDTQYGALTQAEWLDPTGEPMKTVTVLNLKKSAGQWLVKSIDLRNHASRAKTRFVVTAAALDLALPPAAFAPEALAAPPPPVPPGQIERL